MKRALRTVLAALSLFALLGLLAAGCRPAETPSEIEARAQRLAAFLRCSKCLQRSCYSELMICKDDPAPSTTHDGNRCTCLFGARVQGRHTQWSLDHCGMYDDTYNALVNCNDTNCSDRCPHPLEET